jgi:hypothetical protein
MNGYIQFVSTIGAVDGMSVEAKERAVAAFYEKLVSVEHQLAHIYDQIRLE